MAVSIHEPILLRASVSYLGTGGTALLLFVVAVAAVTAACGRRRRRRRPNNSSSLLRAAHAVAFFGYVLAFVARDVVAHLVRVARLQIRNVASDVVAFPLALCERGRKPPPPPLRPRVDDDEEEGGDVCRLMMGGLYSLTSVDADGAIHLGDFDDAPPTQLVRVVENLARPPNLFLPLSFPSAHGTAWKQFQMEATYPWLWLHTKHLAVFLLGALGFICDVFKVIRYAFLPQSARSDDGPSFNLSLVGVAICYVCWVVSFDYWMHAFRRSASRVCARWDPYFREQGCSVEFCSVRTAAANRHWLSDLLSPIREEKCFIRFRPAPSGT